MQYLDIGLEEKYRLQGEACTLALQPYHHLQCLLPSPGLHCSTHWAETILRPAQATVDNTNESFVAPECAFSAPGVRRSGWWKVGWGGETLTGRWSFGGGRGLRGEAEFGDKASVVLLKWFGTTVTLWHCGLTKIHRHTHHPLWHVDPVHHLHSYNVQGRENRITNLLTAFRAGVNTIFSTLDIFKTKSQCRCRCQSTWMCLSRTQE